MPRIFGAGNLPPRRVLVVDGDAHNTALLREILAPLDIEIEAAESGRAGLRLAQFHPPDLVLMEIVLPDMNGIDLCAHFKSLPGLRDTPVLFATGVEDPHAQAEALDAGCAGLLMKPLRKVLVRAAVKSAFLLKATLDANRRLLEQRASLAAMLVHDMRNLIQANQGFAKLALRDGGATPEIADSLRLIDQTAEELRMLANGLLDVERLEEAALPVRRDRLALAEAARRRVGLAGRNIRQVKVRVVPLEGEEPVVAGDPGLLNRLLDNLLFNAVKFSPDGGSVDLLFRRVPGGWETRIENDGPAIPSEFHEKIFEKFGQLPAPGAPGENAEPLRGVGLGLAFCRMAARAMDGTIHVESPLPGRGDGVSFSFVLPEGRDEP